MKDKAGMMATPPYAADQTTYIFPGTGWEGYEQEGTRAGENLKRGYEPLETFPAKWHNTVMNRFSIALQQAKVALDGLYDEMKSILSAAQIQPSEGQINQVLLAIQKLTELHIASATTLGGVLSNPSEAWGVEVDQSTGKMKTKTQLATAQDAGLVKSSATGVDPNRTYNVEVKSDGTMKVCVPWIEGGIPSNIGGTFLRRFDYTYVNRQIRVESPVIAYFYISNVHYTFALKFEATDTILPLGAAANMVGGTTTVSVILPANQNITLGYVEYTTQFHPLSVDFTDTYGYVCFFKL